MEVVKAFFDGQEIKLVEPVKATKKTEVLVIFPDNFRKYAPEEARRLLRGSGKGIGLTERLLKSRAEDAGLHGQRCLSQARRVIEGKDGGWEGARVRRWVEKPGGSYGFLRTTVNFLLTVNLSRRVEYRISNTE